MGIDLDYFEKRVRSLEQALHRLQHDLEDAHEIAGRIVEEYQQWVKNETPGRELILRRLEELIARGSPRSVFAKTLVLEFGISRTKSYQMVKDYLVRTRCGGRHATRQHERGGVSRLIDALIRTFAFPRGRFARMRPAPSFAACFVPRKDARAPRDNGSSACAMLNCMHLPGDIGRPEPKRRAIKPVGRRRPPSP